MTEYNGSQDGLDRVVLWRLIGAAVLFAASLATKNALPIPSVILAVLCILIAGYDVLIRAVADGVRDRAPNETLLMCVVAVVAVIIGRAPEGGLVMLLVKAGELFRSYAVEKVRRSIDAAAESGELPQAVQAVRNGDGEKSRAEEFITHFAAIYTPVILFVAVLLAAVLPLFFQTTVAEGIYKALILIVIACPCALVISIPLSYYAGIGGASRQGVLFRSSAAVDRCCGVGTVVFDRAGALEGKGLRVISVKSDRMDAQVMLRIAAHACAYAEGAHAESIKAAYEGSIYIELIQSFRQEPDRGITVEVDGVSILLGTEAFVREHGVDPGGDAVAEDSAYLAIDGQYTGRILFGSVSRENTGRTVQMLAWENGRQILLVSDESAAATEKFARSVGIGQYYADCSGEDKAALIRDLGERKARKGALMFVGSGETDGECLRQAEIGVAMGAAAPEGTDILLPKGDPAQVPTALEAAAHTKRIVRQNILAVLGFKLFILLLDILGVCPLWLAVFADSGVALAAILNCLRALAVKPAVLPET